MRRAVSSIMAGWVVDLVRNLCVTDAGMHRVATAEQQMSLGHDDREGRSRK